MTNKRYVLSALMGMVVGIWLIFIVKHIELVIMSILCILALRYLFLEF